MWLRMQNGALINLATMSEIFIRGYDVMAIMTESSEEVRIYKSDSETQAEWARDAIASKVNALVLS